MQCPQCSVELEGEASFCDECGAPLTKAALALPPRVPRTQAQVSTGLAAFSDPRPFNRSGYSRKANSPATALSHWNQFIRGLDMSPMDFYRAVRSTLERRGLPDVWLALVAIPEGGIFSPKREYLRLIRRDHIVDICGAPYADGFFVSWWLGPRPRGCLSLFLVIPFFFLLYARFIRPHTYYETDVGSMFLTAAHSAVLEVIDQMTESRGIRALTELERKPIHRGFFGK
jgi:hypothetical protein